MHYVQISCFVFLCLYTAFIYACLLRNSNKLSTYRYRYMVWYKKHCHAPSMQWTMGPKSDSFRVDNFATAPTVSGRQEACCSSANRAKPLESTIHTVRLGLTKGKWLYMASESLLCCISPFLRHLRNQWPWITLKGHSMSYIFGGNRKPVYDFI